ncbi:MULTISPECIES: hypothetical protein [unclassified Microbacterium]|uniref:hypothetical protein n=1 Tax=unclassified Microbacterium TaxID=2609290 RepID=UPI0011B074CE|nr:MULTISPECIES: hypothetical protein [unclassified Microbacterium]
MDVQLLAMLGLVIGSAGAAGLVSVLIQVSYPRRLEGSIRRLAEAKTHVETDQRVLLVIEQALRQDATLLALSRLHGITVWGIFARIMLVLGFVGALAGGAFLYLQWRPDQAGPEYAALDGLLWMLGIMLLSYPAVGITALHFERRARERRFAATVLFLDGTSVQTPEIVQARRRWARSRRVHADLQKVRSPRWSGGPDRCDSEARVRQRWAKARAMAIRRLRRRERGPSARDLIRRFDTVNVWPYVVTPPRHGNRK